MMLDIKSEGYPLTAARSKQSRATFFIAGFCRREAARSGGFFDSCVGGNAVYFFAFFAFQGPFVRNRETCALLRE